MPSRLHPAAAAVSHPPQPPAAASTPGAPGAWADAGAASDAADDGGPECGWFASSFVLRQGLAVCELADPDGSLHARWFAPARRPALQ